MLGNINDNFDEIDLSRLNPIELPELEQLMLHKIYNLNSNFKRYFESYDFHNLYKELLNFCTVDLSAFYFDIRKDCLYCDPKNSNKRESVITLLKVILNILLKWFAPILSFTTEEIFRLLNKSKSVHLEKFIDIPEIFKNDKLYSKWLKLIEIRDICNHSIEEKRAAKIIGSSLEATLHIKLNKKTLDLIKNIDLAELCITSSVNIEETHEDKISVKTDKANGTKCEVCWKISPDPCERHSS